MNFKIISMLLLLGSVSIGGFQAGNFIWGTGSNGGTVVSSNTTPNKSTVTNDNSKSSNKEQSSNNNVTNSANSNQSKGNNEVEGKTSNNVNTPNTKKVTDSTPKVSGDSTPTKTINSSTNGENKTITSNSTADKTTASTSKVASQTNVNTNTKTSSNVTNKVTEATPNTNNSDFMAQVEQSIYKQVNEQRVKAGVAPLAYNATMQQFARGKSEDMGKNNYFSHENPQGQYTVNLIQKAGIPYTYWGENIAYIEGVTNPTQLANEFVTNWMNSPGHRANILSPNFKSTGIGVYKAGNKVYATQEFYTK